MFYVNGQTTRFAFKGSQKHFVTVVVELIFSKEPSVSETCKVMADVQNQRMNKTHGQVKVMCMFLLLKHVLYC